MIELLDSFRRVRRSLNLLAVKELKPLELGTKQAAVIRRLAEQKRCSQAELARLSHTDPAATGRILDGLIQRGLVLREEHPSDRRRWSLSLSAEGRHLAGRIDHVFDGMARQLAAPLNGRERTQMIEWLDRVNEALLHHTQGENPVAVQESA